MFKLKNGFDYALKNTFLANKDHIHPRLLEGVYFILDYDTSEIMVYCYEYNLKGRKSCYITGRNGEKAFTLSAEVNLSDSRRNALVEAFSKMYDFDSDVIRASSYVLLHEAAKTLGCKESRMFYIENEK